MWPSYLTTERKTNRRRVRADANTARVSTISTKDIFLYNRLAKEKEIARVNYIIAKKLLNAKPSVLSFR